MGSGVALFAPPQWLSCGALVASLGCLGLVFDGRSSNDPKIASASAVDQ
ncbi:unnamed protein product [Acidithrix sp. C25]|nr:unnamed protein product [Acidithrix sp. C25]